MAKRSESGGRGQGPQSPGQEAVSQGVQAYKEVALAAIRRAPPWMAPIVFIAFGAGLLVFVVAGIFAFLEQQSVYAFWLVLAGLVFLLFSTIFLTILLITDMKRSAPTAGGGRLPPCKPYWARAVPKLPIPDDDLNALGEDLKNIRNCAFVLLSTRCKGLAISAGQIRANVFLADYSKATGGSPFVLRIVNEKLQVGMEGSPDKEIEFHPGQGVTGTVFASQQPVKARALEAESRDATFDEVYQLSEKQQRIVHPDLRWIVSFPLKTDGKTAGVLNVDGLRHELADDDLDALMGGLFSQVMAYSARVLALPTVRLSMTVEDAPDA